MLPRWTQLLVTLQIPDGETEASLLQAPGAPIETGDAWRTSVCSSCAKVPKCRRVQEGAGQRGGSVRPPTLRPGDLDKPSRGSVRAGEGVGLPGLELQSVFCCGSREGGPARGWDCKVGDSLPRASERAEYWLVSRLDGELQAQGVEPERTDGRTARGSAPQARPAGTVEPGGALLVPEGVSRARAD